MSKNLTTPHKTIETMKTEEIKPVGILSSWQDITNREHQP